MDDHDACVKLDDNSFERNLDTLASSLMRAQQTQLHASAVEEALAECRAALAPGIGCAVADPGRLRRAAGHAICAQARDERVFPGVPVRRRRTFHCDPPDDAQRETTKGGPREKAARYGPWAGETHYRDVRFMYPMSVTMSIKKNQIGSMVVLAYTRRLA